MGAGPGPAAEVIPGAGPSSPGRISLPEMSFPKLCGLSVPLSQTRGWGGNGGTRQDPSPCPARRGGRQQPRPGSAQSPRPGGTRATGADFGDIKRGTGGRTGGIGDGWPAGSGSTPGRLARNQEDGPTANPRGPAAGMPVSGGGRDIPPSSLLPAFFHLLNAGDSCFNISVAPRHIMNFSIPVLPPP